MSIILTGAGPQQGGAGGQPSFSALPAVLPTGLFLSVDWNVPVSAGTGSPTATADLAAITLGTPVLTNGGRTWTYPITSGNPSGNPVLAGAAVVLTYAAGVWVSTANGVPNAAVSGASVTNNSTVLVPAGIAGLQLWLKADGTLWQLSTLSTPAVADNDPVGAWVDSSTGGLNVIQATAGLRPTLKTNVLNGLPVIRGDGTSQYLRNATGLAQGDFTIFIVARMPNSGDDKAVVSWGNRTTGQARQFHHRSTGQVRAFIGFTNDANSSVAWGNDVWSIWDATGSGVPTSGSAAATISHRVNGASAGSGAPTLTAFASNNLTVFANTAAAEWWPRDIAEIIVYSSVLTAPQIAAVEAYLNAKWVVY